MFTQVCMNMSVAWKASSLACKDKNYNPSSPNPLQRKDNICPPIWLLLVMSDPAGWLITAHFHSSWQVKQDISVLRVCIALPPPPPHSHGLAREDINPAGQLFTGTRNDKGGNKKWWCNATTAGNCKGGSWFSIKDCGTSLFYLVLHPSLKQGPPMRLCRPGVRPPRADWLLEGWGCS